MGVAAGVPEKLLSKQLGITVAEFRELKKRYKQDIKELQVHRAVCDRVFPDLTRVRMTRLQMRLLDTIFADLEDPESRLNNDQKVRADLLKFLSRHLESIKDATPSGEQGDLSDEEFQERLEALMEAPDEAV